MDANRWSHVVESRRRYDAGDPVAAPGPLEAFFEVAARCNLHCRMCAINFDTRYLPGSPRPPFLEPALFDRLRPIFPTLQRAYLFGLGEPLLNRHLVEYVEELSAAGVEVWFNTNGTLIDDARADALARAGASAITVSIDGATAATYEQIRVGAKFHECLRGIRALVAAGRRRGRPAVDLSFVAMAGNLAELPALVDLGAELGVRGIHVEPLYSQIQHDLQEHYARENLGRLPGEAVAGHFRAAAERAKARKVRLASRFLSDGGSADYVERARSFRTWWSCSEPWSSIWVTSAGEVRTCCINETSFGNLHETPFSGIWNGGAYAAFRLQHARGRETPAGCANCLRNGRMRHSPYYAPVRAVTYRPIADPAEAPAEVPGVAIDWPAPHATVTDPLVVVGSVPEGFRGGLVVDRSFAAPLERCAVVRNGRFIASLDVPFLTEGAHRIGLGGTGGVPAAERTVHVWRPSEGDRAAGWGAVVRRMRFPSPRAEVRIDGAPVTGAIWLWARSGRGWKGAAAFPLEGVAGGLHAVEVRRAGRVWRFPVRKIADQAPERVSPLPSQVASLSS